MMKHRPLLLLLEICIMTGILFAVAAICLSGLGKAKLLTRESNDLSQCSAMCENLCEILRESGGDVEMAKEFAREFEAKGGYVLRIEEKSSSQTGLGLATVSFEKDGETVFSLPASWLVEVDDE